MKLEGKTSEQFLLGFEISRAFIRAKQEGEKGGKIQNPAKIAHKAVHTRKFSPRLALYKVA